LNQEFLENVAKNGSRLLHLTPYLNNVDGTQSKEMIIEGDNFKQLNLSPDQLVQIFKLEKGQNLNVHFVLIEMPNCN
jgi:hypothetical protein